MCCLLIGCVLVDVSVDSVCAGGTCLLTCPGGCMWTMCVLVDVSVDSVCAGGHVC